MAGRVVAVVKDLFFGARIRETARVVGTPLAIVQTPERLVAELAAGAPELVIVDLTTPALDYEAVFHALETLASGTAVLGYTTHALAGETRPLHARCRRVVTKETLTRELGDILRRGLAA
jgi:hypothetical protein